MTYPGAVLSCRSCPGLRGHTPSGRLCLADFMRGIDHSEWIRGRNLQNERLEKYGMREGLKEEESE